MLHCPFKEKLHGSAVLVSLALISLALLVRLPNVDGWLWFRWVFYPSIWPNHGTNTGRQLYTALSPAIRDGYFYRNVFFNIRESEHSRVRCSTRLSQSCVQNPESRDKRKSLVLGNLCIVYIAATLLYSTVLCNGLKIALEVNLPSCRHQKQKKTLSTLSQR